MDIEKQKEAYEELSRVVEEAVGEWSEKVDLSNFDKMQTVLSFFTTRLCEMIILASSGEEHAKQGISFVGVVGNKLIREYFDGKTEESRA